MATVRGGSGPDTLDGTAADDILYDVGGTNLLRGLGGNDQLFFGSGTNAQGTLEGGEGQDTLFAALGDLPPRNCGVTAHLAMSCD